MSEQVQEMFSAISGTYDKVNSGGTYIQTPSGRVDVPENRAAFVPHGAKAGGPTPRLLDAIPHLYKSTKNEHLLEHRHETTQRLLEKHREDRRKVILQRKASPDRLKPQTEGKQDALPHLGDKAANQTAEQRKGLSEEKREARQKANEQRKQAQEKRRSRQELAKQRAEERKKKNAERKDVRKVEKE